MDHVAGHDPPPGLLFSIKGSGGGLNIALGGAVAPGLIVFGELFDKLAVDPEVELATFGSADIDANAVVVGLGAGVTYYLLSNSFFAGALTVQQLSLQQDGDEVAESKFGTGLKLQFGHEWWVGADWGLGLCAQMFLGRMRDKNIGLGNPPTWSAWSLNVLFSASYN